MILFLRVHLRLGLHLRLRLFQLILPHAETDGTQYKKGIDFLAAIYGFMAIVFTAGHNPSVAGG